MNLEELKNQFPTAPEYLTQIFLIDRDYGVVSNARLSERLHVSRPAVTQAIGRLRRLGLVLQDRYGTIELTVQGREFAENLVRRHFLLEHLLVNLLDYPWDKSDAEAHALQDSISDEFAEHLAERLNQPQTCPHGNPMPGSSLEEAYLNASALTETNAGDVVRILRISEEGELVDGVLHFCQAKGIMPGCVLTVLGQESKGTQCTVDSNKLLIPVEYAAYLRWEPV